MYSMIHHIIIHTGKYGAHKRVKAVVWGQKQKSHKKVPKTRKENTHLYCVVSQAVGMGNPYSHIATQRHYSYVTTPALIYFKQLSYKFNWCTVIPTGLSNLRLSLFEEFHQNLFPQVTTDINFQFYRDNTMLPPYWK